MSPSFEYDPAAQSVWAALEMNAFLPAGVGNGFTSNLLVQTCPGTHSVFVPSGLHLKPSGQSVQTVPPTSENYPEVHATGGSVASGHLNPSGHAVQAVVAPNSEYVPGRHLEGSYTLPPLQ